jgi:23S rRNA pseudouridine955/2504/2580 synthase
MKKILNVTEDYHDMRIDRWVKKKIFNVPQSLIEKSLRQGKIKVNNLIVKNAYKLKYKDKIYLYNFNPETTFLNKKKYVPTKKDIHSSESFIIENNENFVVINKPPGLPVQGGTKTYKNLVDNLSNSEVFKNSKPYIVHRIDKDTSGILIIAKTRKFAQLLTSLFRIRKIYKTYLAICYGSLEKNSGELINDLTRYEGKKKIIENAKTIYNVIDKNNFCSLISLNPITGRKHQIRKQLSMIGNPVLGDNKYNFETKGKKLMLHAYSIKFMINDIKYNYKVKYPDYFQKVMKKKRLRFT